MFQITVNVFDLTTEQRESVAAFIRNFPTNEIALSGDDEPAIIPGFAVIEDEDDPNPNEVFGGHHIVPPPPAPLTVEAESQLDKAGLPWDERIHSSNHARTADGYWRKRRGADDATVAQVEGQLKGLMAIPAPPVLAVVPPPPPVESVAVPPPPPATEGNPAQPFIDFVKRASAAIGANTITMEELTACCLTVGVAALPLLSNRIDLVPQVAASVDKLIASRAA
jgi:hypothetical protein